jgi:hypothetical protein
MEPSDPALKLSRSPRSFAATLAALPSISEIPFLDSCVPDLVSSWILGFQINSGFDIGRWTFAARGAAHI